MKNILVVGPAWVGDMVMAQSLFKLIKQRQPEASIDVLAPSWSQSLLSCMPEVRQTFISPFAHGELRLRERLLLAKDFAKKNYQQAIVLPQSFKSALIPFFANIPQRTGWLGEMRWGLLNDIRYSSKQKYALMVERFAALALAATDSLPAEVPWPALVVDPVLQQQTREKFQLLDFAKPILAVCPGAEYGPAKRWPAEHFAKLIEAKIEQGWQIWMFGSAKDQDIANEIQQTSRQGAVDLTGKTSLKEALQLLAAATAVVTNDSGLMHIAAGLDKPVVAIYGSSSPAFTPPLSNKTEIVSLQLSCSPCFNRKCPLGHLKCLRELSPAQVLLALNNLLHTAQRN